MIWDIRKKKKSITTTKRKKNPRNNDGISSFGTTSRAPTLTSQGCQMENRKSKKLEVYLKK